MLWRGGRSMKHLFEKLTIAQEMQLITKNWIRSKSKFLSSLILGNSRLQNNTTLYLYNNGTSFKTNNFSFTNIQTVLICTLHYGLPFYTAWNKINLQTLHFPLGLKYRRNSLCINQILPCACVTWEYFCLTQSNTGLKLKFFLV